MSISADCTARLLSTLESQGSITASNRAVIERFGVTWEVTAFHALLMTNLLSESDLADTLAKATGLHRYQSFGGAQVATSALAVIPFERARDWECLPLLAGTNGLTVVFADPTRHDRIDEIKRGLNQEFTLAVGGRSDIVKAIDELYPLAAQLPSLYGR